jgi:hypothetical protein
MWTGGPSVWDSWSECCADCDVATHPDKVGMHIMCLPESGVRQELQQEPPRTAWHSHPCALFRSRHEAAQCLRMTSVTVCSCQLFELNGQGRWSWRWHFIFWDELAADRRPVRILLCFCPLRALLLTNDLITGRTM